MLLILFILSLFQAVSKIIPVLPYTQLGLSYCLDPGMTQTRILSGLDLKVALIMFSPLLQEIPNCTAEGKSFRVASRVRY